MLNKAEPTHKTLDISSLALAEAHVHKASSVTT